MNRSDNQPNDDAEGYDLDHVLDDAFTTRRVPVLSPSMMDVRRRARRRTNRTRATGLAAVACVSVGGVAALANNRKPDSKPATGAAVAYGGDPCAPATTWETVPPVTAPTSTWEPAPTTTVLSAGFLAAATTTTIEPEVVTPTTTCLPQPPSGFRCAGEPTVTQDGWVYYDYCEPVVDTAPATTIYSETTVPYFETTMPSPTTTLFGEEAVYTVVFGDYLFGIAKEFCTTAEDVAAFNAWPEGINHPMNPGDVVRIPPAPSSCSADTGFTDVTTVFPTTVVPATTELPATSTTQP